MTHLHPLATAIVRHSRYKFSVAIHYRLSHVKSVPARIFQGITLALHSRFRHTGHSYLLPTTYSSSCCYLLLLSFLVLLATFSISLVCTYCILLQDLNTFFIPDSCLCCCMCCVDPWTPIKCFSSLLYFVYHVLLYVALYGSSLKSLNSQEFLIHLFNLHHKTLLNTFPSPLLYIQCVLLYALP